MTEYDLIIAGAGPAACSAALTARARDLSVLVIGTENTGWLSKAESIANYPGLPMVSGKELLSVFRKQAEEAGAVFLTGLVRQIQPTKKGHMVLVGSDIFTARSVIIATGAAAPKLLPGEETLLGQGVSWCGTCDGMFFRGQKVAVLSYWHAGIEEADFLARFCSQVDYYVMRPHDLSTEHSWNICSGIPQGLAEKDGQILLDMKDKTLPYDGVFIFRPAVAPDKMTAGLAVEGAFIKTDKAMQTNIPGLFAAGDCTGQPLQIAKAVGEGCVAAISAAAYVARKENT